VGDYRYSAPGVNRCWPAFIKAAVQAAGTAGQGSVSPKSRACAMR